MRLVSPVLKHFVYPGLARTGYLRRRAHDIPAVLTYHGVFPGSYRVRDRDLDGNLVTVANFRRQLELLKTHYNLITPDQFLAWCGSKQSLPPRSVLLTCDDGLQNVLTSMLPVLHEQAASCLFFVTGASLGDQPSMLWYEELYLMLLDGRDDSDLELPEAGIRARVPRTRKRVLWWNLVKKFSQVSSQKRRALLQEVGIQLGLSDRWSSAYIEDAVQRGRFCALTLSELRQLAASGMAIGAHTLSHPVLSLQSAELCSAEISECRLEIQKALNCDVRAFAYPFGDSASAGAREFGMAEAAGYECAFLNIEDNSPAKTSVFALPRIHVTGETSLPEFEAHISGFYHSLRRHFSVANDRELEA